MEQNLFFEPTKESTSLKGKENGKRTWDVFGIRKAFAIEIQHFFCRENAKKHHFSSPIKIEKNDVIQIECVFSFEWGVLSQDNIELLFHSRRRSFNCSIR